MHPKQIIKLLAFVMLIVALAMVIPLLVAHFNNEVVCETEFRKAIFYILVPSLLISVFIKKENYSYLSQKDGFLFTVFTWIIATAVGAIPLFTTKVYPTYADAFFEIMSGFTTTGSTTLADIDNCYKSILIWRSLTNWLGGMGIVVLFVALLPALGAGGGAFNLIGAETVGPVKGKFTPKTKTTAISLWLIYIGLTLLQVVLLLLGKLPLFDAITIAFSTLSTAGFSIKGASIGAYNSAYVEIIVTVFMLLAATNFSIYYQILTGKVKNALKDSELKWFISIVIVSIVLGSVGLSANRFYSIGESIRHVAFQVASVISTTGFTSVNFITWPSFSLMILLLLMFVGGCAGSTGGGMKVTRIATVWKSGNNILKQKIHPASVLSQNKDAERSIASFCGIYMITWFIGALVLSLSGLDIMDSLSTSICCLGNIGVGFSPVTNSCLSFLPGWTKFFCSALMLAGRLELFTLYALFSSSFWKR